VLKKKNATPDSGLHATCDNPAFQAVAAYCADRGSQAEELHHHHHHHQDVQSVSEDPDQRPYLWDLEQ